MRSADKPKGEQSNQINAGTARTASDRKILVIAISVLAVLLVVMLVFAAVAMTKRGSSHAGDTATGAQTSAASEDKTGAEDSAKAEQDAKKEAEKKEAAAAAKAKQEADDKAKRISEQKMQKEQLINQYRSQGMKVIEGTIQIVPNRSAVCPLNGTSYTPCNDTVTGLGCTPELEKAQAVLVLDSAQSFTALVGTAPDFDTVTAKALMLDSPGNTSRWASHQGKRVAIALNSNASSMGAAGWFDFYNCGLKLDSQDYKLIYASH